MQYLALTKKEEFHMQTPLFRCLNSDVIESNMQNNMH